ncbi:DUF4181 domain-containing protein [Sporosarcina sp. FA9]|uniref:DUF4181 domain-containing protein n=1 Tax=Sporosarcina sp. FA9 TaxID=3413030 RepID=UPI003F65A36D
MLVFIVITTLIFLLYIYINRFILKRKLNIEEKRLHMFSKDRNNFFLIAEIIAIIAFTVISIVYIDIALPTNFSPTFIPKLTFVFLFVIQVIRGLELWVFNREEKLYYYQSLGAALFLIMFFIFYFSENYLI